MTTTTTRRGRNIYDAIGGADAVGATVSLLYQKILADPALVPYFEDVDLRRLRGHMRAFLAVALGGPNLYKGRDLGAAHAHLGISDEHFDAVAGHLVATLAELGVPDELIQTIVGQVASLRPLIVSAPLAEAV